MITAGATPTPKTIDQRRVALTSPQVKTLQTDNAGTLGLYCRADDRGDTVVQVAPPLICGQQEFDEMESILRSVFSDAWALL
jgi:adenosylmethionine-8-amino-7-oxononanoate aminotransferase